MRNRRAQVLAKWVVVSLLAGAGVTGGGVAVWRVLRPAVEVTRAVEGPVVAAFYATGTVSPVREYPIKSNVAGILKVLKKDKGDAVAKDEILAVVEDPALEYQVAKTTAELEEKTRLADDKTSPVLQEFDDKLKAMQAMLATAEREEKRLTSVVEKDAASQTDLDRVQDRVKTLWSEAESLKSQKESRRISLHREVKVAQAALLTAEWNRDQQTIRSPIDGVVLDRPTSLGTRLAINDHIMQIADIAQESLVMRAAVDEEDRDKVRLEQPVRMVLYSFPDRTFEGRVRTIYPKADAERRTFEVDVKFIRSSAATTQPATGPATRGTGLREQLSPGMTGELAFIVDHRERALVVPSQALQGGALWTVKDNRLSRADAEIGLKSIERVEVLSGLRPGDIVVISPVGELKEGQVVRVGREVDPAAAAGLNKPKAKQVFRGFN